MHPLAYPRLATILLGNGPRPLPALLPIQAQRTLNRHSHLGQFLQPPHPPYRGHQSRIRPLRSCQAPGICRVLLTTICAPKTNFRGILPTRCSNITFPGQQADPPQASLTAAQRSVSMGPAVSDIYDSFCRSCVVCPARLLTENQYLHRMLSYISYFRWGSVVRWTFYRINRP